MIDTGFNLGRKASFSHASPLRLRMERFTVHPAISGTTTKATTLIKSTSHGIVTPATPSNKVTMGTNATSSTKSFTATCTSV